MSPTCVGSSALVAVALLGLLGCREPAPVQTVRLIDLLADAEVSWPAPAPGPPNLPTAEMATEEAQQRLRRVFMPGRPGSEGERVYAPGDEERLALISPNGAGYRFQVTIPAEPVLQLGLGFVPPKGPTDQQIRYVVSLETDAGSKVLLDEKVTVRKFGSWQDRVVDLEAWSGDSVSLTLETFCLPEDCSHWAAWSAPEIVSLKESNTNWNLILVSLDTLRADRLGCYGYDRPTSPNLDAFASRAALFETTVSPSPWTRPSHRALFSGIYPNSHQGLMPRSLASRLWEAGYDTWAVTGGAQVHPRFGFGSGFDEYRVGDWVRAVPELLDEISSKARRRQFLFLHTFEIHDPFIHTEFAEGLPSGDIELPYDFLGTYIPRRNKGIETTEEEKEYVRALYDSGIAFTDRHLGNLFSGLEERGLLDNTIVVLTSDHGEQFWEHEAFGHGFTMYDHQLLVPLIVHLPPKIRDRAGIDARGGLRISQQVRQIDLLPTLLELLAIPLDERVHGRSLLPLLRGESLPDIAAFAENTNINTELKALRTSHYKFVKTYPNRRTRGQHELYNLRDDPGEATNLVEDHPEVVTSLLSRLEAITSATSLDERDEAVPDDIDPSLREQLKALGYVDDG